MEILKQAINKYGEKQQCIKCIEEMSELTKAICKNFECTDERLRPIIQDAIDEEMADVEIMLEQMKMIFDNRSVVEAWKSKKIERLEHRLNGGL